MGSGPSDESGPLTLSVPNVVSEPTAEREPRYESGSGFWEWATHRERAMTEGSTTKIERVTRHESTIRSERVNVREGAMEVRASPLEGGCHTS